jgi:hypothetical protein
MTKNPMLAPRPMRVRFVSRLAMRNMGRANDLNALIAIA